MTNNHPSENPQRHTVPSEQPDRSELRGKYVKGDYGDAGTRAGPKAGDQESQYNEGDFGEAGKQSDLPEPQNAYATEAGTFVQGDYDEAGTAEGRTAESEIGRYTEGDLGSTGMVPPARQATTEPENPAE